MSGADYTLCEHCGRKAFYDADTDTSGTATFHDGCLTAHDAEVREAARAEALPRSATRRAGCAMSLSEERLREIEVRANLQCGLDGDDADDLLAEVKRLREGIEALAESFEEDVDWSSCRGDYGDNAAYEACARRARDLLNPTEGETDADA